MQDLGCDVRFKVPFNFKGYDFPVGIRVWDGFNRDLYVTAEDYLSSYPQADLETRDYAGLLSLVSGWNIVYCRTLARKIASECWSKYEDALEEIDSLLKECVRLCPCDESELTD